MTHYGMRCMECDKLLEYNHTDIQLLQERCIPCIVEKGAHHLKLLAEVLMAQLYPRKTQDQDPYSALQIKWAIDTLSAVVETALPTTPEGGARNTILRDFSRTTDTPSPEPQDHTGSTTSSLDPPGSPGPSK